MIKTALLCVCSALLELGFCGPNFMWSFDLMPAFKCAFSQKRSLFSLLTSLQSVQWPAADVYCMWQVLAEQARRLGIQIENQPRSRGPRTTAAPSVRKPRDLGSALEISTIHQRVRNMMKAKNVDFALKPAPAAPAEAALPKGWEEQVDPGTNRKFYIDHINRVRHMIAASPLQL